MKIKVFDCNDCHSPIAEDKQAGYLAAFENEDDISTDFTSFSSNFAGLAKESCEMCHTSKNAGNNCLVCHNYHVEEVRVHGTVPTLAQMANAGEVNATESDTAVSPLISEETGFLEENTEKVAPSAEEEDTQPPEEETQLESAE